GIMTIGQLADTPEQILADHFGEIGRHMRQLANGLDDRAVVPDGEAKSVSTETTFPQDVGDRDTLRGWLVELVEELGQRLRWQGLRTAAIELKLRSSDFTTYHRSQTLERPTDITEEIWTAAARAFNERVPDAWLPLRLLGVGATHLSKDGVVQGSLFDEEWRAKHRAVDQAMDAIRTQFGQEAIRRAEGMGR